MTYELAEIDGSVCLKCRAGYMTEVDRDNRTITYICTGCERTVEVKQARRLNNAS